MKRPEDPRQLYAIGAFLVVGGVLAQGLSLPNANKVMFVLMALMGVAIIVRGVVIALVRKRNARAEVQARAFD